MTVQEVLIGNNMQWHWGIPVLLYEIRWVGTTRCQGRQRPAKRRDKLHTIKWHQSTGYQEEFAVRTQWQTNWCPSLRPCYLHAIIFPPVKRPPEKCVGWLPTQCTFFLAQMAARLSQHLVRRDGKYRLNVARYINYNSDCVVRRAFAVMYWCREFLRSRRSAIAELAMEKPAQLW